MSRRKLLTMQHGIMPVYILVVSSKSLLRDGQLDLNPDRMQIFCMDLLMQLLRNFKTKKLETIFLINKFMTVTVGS